MWEIASEGVQRDFGWIIHTPPPEAHELRGAQLSIFINCARGFSIIHILYENTPSSEPDELSIILVSGSWRVLPYLDAVFKPIKDGINNWIKGVGQTIINGFEIRSNSKSGKDEDGEGYISDENTNAFLNALDGGNFNTV